MAKHAKTLLQNLGEKAASEDKPFEIQPVLYATTIEIMAEAIFKSSVMSSKELGQLFKEAFENTMILVRVVPVLDLLLLGPNRKVNKVRAVFANVLQKLRQDYEAHKDLPSTEENDGTPPALVDFLLSSNAFSDTQLLDHLMTFMFAGNDTTNTALHWLMYLVAENQHVQEKLYEELCDAFGKGKACQVEDIAGCTYLSRCVKESLRVRPPSVSGGRTTLEDDVLPGTKSFVPKGTLIEIHSWTAMQIEEYWGPNPYEYNPERWENLPPLGQKYSDIAWMPFFSGARGCIGKDFAMHELLLLTATMFRNFKFTLPADEPAPIAAREATVCPKKPVRVLVSNRTA